MKWKGRGWTRKALKRVSEQDCMCDRVDRMLTFLAYELRHSHTNIHAHTAMCIYTQAPTVAYFFFLNVLHSSLKQPEWSGKEK